MAAVWQYRAPLTGFRGISTPAEQSISINSDSNPACGVPRQSEPTMAALKGHK